MIDVEYSNIGSKQKNPQITNLKSMTYNNGLDKEQTFSLEVADTITKKQHWSVSAGLESVFNVSVTAGILEVVSATVGWSLNVPVSDTYEMENTKIKEETWSFLVTVQANTKLLASISIWKSDIPYTGRLQ